MRRYVEPSGPQPVPGTATRHPTRRRGNRPTAGEWCVVPAERMGKSPPTDPRERDDPLATRARPGRKRPNVCVCVCPCDAPTQRRRARHAPSLRANTARVECRSGGRSGKAAAAPERPSLGPSPRGAPPDRRARCGRSAAPASVVYQCVGARARGVNSEARAAGRPPPCNERSRGISRHASRFHSAELLQTRQDLQLVRASAPAAHTTHRHVSCRGVNDTCPPRRIHRNKWAPHTRARTDPAHNLCYRSSPSDTPPRPPRVHTATLMPGHRHHIPRAPPTCHGTCTASRAYGPTRSLAHSLRPPGAAAAGDMPPPPLCAPQKPRAARFAASCRALNSAFLRAASRAASALASPKVY